MRRAGGGITGAGGRDEAAGRLDDFEAALEVAVVHEIDLECLMIADCHLSEIQMT